MVGGQRVEGGSETDDDSLRRMKTNKQRQLSNPMDWRLQKSADKVCVLSPQRSCGGYSWGGKVYWMTFKWWLQWKSPYSCPSMWTSRWKWFLNTMLSLLFNEMEHLKDKWWMLLSSGPRSFHISFFNRIDSCLLTYIDRYPSGYQYITLIKEHYHEDNLRSLERINVSSLIWEASSVLQLPWR